MRTKCAARTGHDPDRRRLHPGRPADSAPRPGGRGRGVRKNTLEHARTTGSAVHCQATGSAWVAEVRSRRGRGGRRAAQAQGWRAQRASLSNSRPVPERSEQGSRSEWGRTPPGRGAQRRRRGAPTDAAGRCRCRCEPRAPRHGARTARSASWSAQLTEGLGCRAPSSSDQGSARRRRLARWAWRVAPRCPQAGATRTRPSSICTAWTRTRCSGASRHSPVRRSKWFL